MTAAAAPLPRAGLSPAPWMLAAAGFVAMYAPTYWSAAHGLWQTDDFGHGPIVLAVALWLLWQSREQIAGAPYRPAGWAGWPLFAVGLLLYVLGRTFDVSSIEFASQVFVLASILLLLRGTRALHLAWFPVLYWIFMVPLPGSVVDALTSPLKQWISWIVVELLYAVGYPIARSGVVITIGPYQMLVADACSGLNSMFSLSALGALFMYLTARKSRVHNAIMLASILPIAFAANIVRVILLVLVTHHFGDEAGQGFLHGAAGIVLMLVALGIFFGLDRLLSLLLPSGGEAAAAPPRA